MKWRLRVAVILSIAVLFTWTWLASLWLSGSKQVELGKFESQDGSIYSGAWVGGYDKAHWDDWTALMGGKPAGISHTFEGFDTHFSYDLSVADEREAVPLITWQPDDPDPGVIARADRSSIDQPTDEIILRNAKYSVDYGKPIFLRIGQEMNGYWMPWCALNEDATSRDHTAADFGNMWRRIVIIFRGGYVRDINLRLTEHGMPPLDAGTGSVDGLDIPPGSEADSYIEPASNVAFVWTPNEASTPNVDGNRPADYYPGDEFVDWVGQDFYNSPWNQPRFILRDKLDSFYAEYSLNRGKPYMVGEYGVSSYTGDDPSFIDNTLSWAKNRDRVKALVYFNGRTESSGQDHRLAYYPNSADALKTGLAKPEFTNEVFPGPTTNTGTYLSWTRRMSPFLEEL
jgi:hypothetical protein